MYCPTSQIKKTRLICTTIDTIIIIILFMEVVTLLIKLSADFQKITFIGSAEFIANARLESVYL